MMDGNDLADVRLAWANGVIDAVIENDDVASDEGLETAIFLSLFMDRRAEPDDSLPSEDGDRRGWWGDQFAELEGDLLGSRLWLLDRSANRDDVPGRATLYCKEALQWMLDDRVTEDLGIVVTVNGQGLLIAITIARPGRDPVTFRYQHVWDGEARRLS
jgi:phage gp46-like protein